MKDLDQELKQFVSEYSVENHNYAKKRAGILFTKNPKDISLFNTIGVLFLQNKKYEDSIKVFKKLINLNPKDINTYHNLGVAWTQLDNIDEAIACYLNADKLHSKISLTYYNLAILYSRSHKYNNSITNRYKFNHNNSL